MNVKGMTTCIEYDFAKVFPESHNTKSVTSCLPFNLRRLQFRLRNDATCLHLIFLILLGSAQENFIFNLDVLGIFLDSSTKN